jgi:hypothetical protein
MTTSDDQPTDPTETDAEPELAAVPEPAFDLDVETFVGDMELGELEELEEATGMKMGEILAQFQSKDFGATVLVGIVWLALRRNDPTATMDTARKIKLTAVADSDVEIDEEGNVVDPQ